MKGIGGAISGDPTERELKRRRKSYDVDGVYQPYGGIGSVDGYQDAGQRFNTIIYGGGQYEYDPDTGRVLPKREETDMAGIGAVVEPQPGAPQPGDPQQQPEAETPGQDGDEPQANVSRRRAGPI
jgi:hypothetical protein